MRNVDAGLDHAEDGRGEVVGVVAPELGHVLNVRIVDEFRRRVVAVVVVPVH